MGAGSHMLAPSLPGLPKGATSSNSSATHGRDGWGCQAHPVLLLPLVHMTASPVWNRYSSASSLALADSRQLDAWKAPPAPTAVLKGSMAAASQLQCTECTCVLLRRAVPALAVGVQPAGNAIPCRYCQGIHNPALLTHPAVALTEHQDQ